MRASIVLLIAAFVINLLLDWYVIHQVSRRVTGHRPLFKSLSYILSGVSTAVLLAAIVVPARSGSNDSLLVKMWLLFGFITLILPTVTGVIFDLLASIPVLFRKRRIKALTVTGLVLATVSFIAMWWCALINRYRIDVMEVHISMENLPDSFEGYRIVQFSDLHTGTFGNDTTFVSQLVNRMNDLKPDVILFTGDIVNRQTDEMYTFVPVLSRLQATDGVIAILGNHDYGDYRNWVSEAAKRENMSRLYRAIADARMELLLNTTKWLHRGNDSIAIIGVENIGDPPFPVYGSLAKSYPNVNDSVAKILLTHNPAHWVDSIADHDDVRIPLTLSGHTHAMQIEVLGVSPAVFRYPTWGGLYTDDSSLHQLYVNIGAGTVGLPMRLGATPEITVITLHQKS